MDQKRTDIYRQRFNKYYQLLCNIAYKYISDRDDCEDIVQEVFISMWRKNKDLLSEKEFLSYIMIAVKNNCISHIRKHRYNTKSIDKTNEKEFIAIEDDNNFVEERLLLVLANLPTKCREIFVMSKMYGMKYIEIAEDLEISIKTVENQMGKAIKTIKELVKNDSLFILIIILTSLIAR